MQAVLGLWAEAASPHASMPNDPEAVERLVKHEREGVARALVEAGEARLRSLGARRITALVAREDAVARAVWLDLGYEDDTQIGRFVRNV